MSMRFAASVVLACSTLCACQEVALVQKQVEIHRHAMTKEQVWETLLAPDQPPIGHKIPEELANDPTKMKAHVDDFFSKISTGGAVGHGAAAAATEASPPTILAAADCDCLSWQQTYLEKKSTCGSALEFAEGFGFNQEDPNSLHHKNGPLDIMGNATSKYFNVHTDLGKHMCDEFFFRRKDNMCTRVAMARSPKKWFGKEWCYVDPKCQSLNGGAAVPTHNVSMKLCGANEGVSKPDKSLSEMGVQELYDYGKTLNVNQALLFKMAYPAEASPWATVQRFWVPASTGDKASLESGPNAIFKSEEWTAEIALEDIIKYKKPVILDEFHRMGSKIIVDGNKVWKLSGPDMVKNGKSQFALTCEKNCDPVAVPEAAPAVAAPAV